MSHAALLDIVGFFSAIIVGFLVITACISEHYEQKHHRRLRKEIENLNH